MNIIEMRPHRGGWQVFEGPGVKPYFTEGDAKQTALEYAKQRLAARAGEIRVFDAAGELLETIQINPTAQRV